MNSRQKTKKELENRGRTVAIVERFELNDKIPAGRRSDMFGIFDLVSMEPNGHIVGVQACGTDLQPHLKKITQEKSNIAKMWLSCGGKIEIWSWRYLVVRRGYPNRHWVPKIIEIREKDLILNEHEMYQLQLFSNSSS